MKVSRFAMFTIGAAVLALHVATAASPQRGAAMKRPLHVTIDNDFEVDPLVYVRYVSEDEAQDPYSRRVGDTVVVDTNDNDELVGLELLDMSAETLKTARALAAEHGASFPAYLRAV
jgi:hypothetical protein